MQKHECASVSLTVRDFIEIFGPQGISAKCSLQFSKKFPRPKLAAILNFRIFVKNANYKFVSISLTMQDRAILSKFSTHRVSQKSTLANFQKIFLCLKMTAILNFRQKWKNTNWLLSP